MSSCQQVEEMIHKIEKGIKIAQDKFEDDLEFKVKNRCERIIERFYGDYSPIYYRRKNTLYNAYKVETIPREAVIIRMNPGGMSGHRASPEYLFETVFEKGYHGGARTEQGYRYRVWPYFKEWSTMPVVRSSPPYGEMVKWAKIIEGQNKKMILDIARNVFSSIL